MTDAPPLKLYHAPRTRAFTALWLLEELGVPYERESFDISSGRHKKPDYLALNPMGKVPLVVDCGRAVSETGAIAIYLCDIHRDAGLAPGFDEDARPAYLRWMFFASAIMEPAYAEKFGGWKQNPSQYAWGSWERMLEVVTAGVSTGSWLLGERFSAADLLVGSNLDFGVKFGLFPKTGAIGEYVGRVTDRDGYRRATAIEAQVGAQFPPQQR